MADKGPPSTGCSSFEPFVDVLLKELSMLRAGLPGKV
jgi:hypothetical protein